MTLVGACRIVRWIPLLFISSFFASSATAQTTQPTELADFKYQGRPIHPGCVWLLRTELSDSLPVCSAIDLVGCTNSNFLAEVRVQARTKWVRMRDKKLLGEGYFEYRWLGRLKNGIHVVWTSVSGGGSGVFQDLVFLRFSTDRVLEEGEWRDRIMMTRCGEHGLGDRTEWSIRLEDNAVVLQEKGEKPITIRFEEKPKSPRRGR